MIKNEMTEKFQGEFDKFFQDNYKDFPKHGEMYKILFDTYVFGLYVATEELYFACKQKGV